MEALPPSLRKWFRRNLLAWFARARRDLPWRRTNDPYAIWVSEIMLQQTQVATVIPYFERFLRAFPDVHRLAEAPEQEVLRLWEGLGYYRRARSLHQAAKQLDREQAGRIPNDPEVLAELPGMGRYTVGAVLSQAFDRRMPILEANSRRVLCRFFGVREDPERGEAQRRLWSTAELLLPRNRCGEFNQALMEIGALVCTPTSPRCAGCPLAKRCLARQGGLQESIPFRSAAQEITEVHELAVLPRHHEKVLILQRPETGRWAGLWEFPHGSLRQQEEHEAAAMRLLTEFTGLKGRLGALLTTIDHSVTRFRIRMVCYFVECSTTVFCPTLHQQGRWVIPEELNDLPVSSPQRRLARLLQDV